MDKIKLKIALLESDVSSTELIKALHISRSKFYKIMRGQALFTNVDIGVIKNICHLTSDQVDKIFFNG